MQRNQKYSRHYFTRLQYYSPILYLLIILFNYRRQAGILIVIGNKSPSLKISCLQCKSTLKDVTWLNSSSKSQTLKQRTTPTDTSGSSLSDCRRASQKKASLKNIVNCKSALETWLNSQSGVIWGRIWDQYHQTLQHVNAETRGRSHIVVLSVLQKAKKVLR